jgi:hypothetical protein
MSTELEMLPVGQLRPNPLNAKQHTPEQLEQLRASIRRFGFRDPIGVDAEDNIIEGHGRYEAALAEGLASVPVIRLAHLTGRQRDAYAIAHNQTQLRTGLDPDKLKQELDRLEVTEADFVSLGLSEDDVYFLGLGDAPAPMAPPAVPASGADSEWDSLVHPVIKTTLRFADEPQYLQFVRLVERLSERYPEEARLSHRLLRFARDAAYNQS